MESLAQLYAIQIKETGKLIRVNGIPMLFRDPIKATNHLLYLTLKCKVIPVDLVIKETESD